MVRFVLEYTTVYGYTMFMDIDGHSEPRQMQSSARNTWETTFDDTTSGHFSYNYFFTNLDDPFGYKFYEDGERRHISVAGKKSVVYDRFDQPTENYVHSQFWDKHGNKVESLDHAYEMAPIRGSLFFFPGNHDYVKEFEELPMELYVQRQGQNGVKDIVEECYCYRLKRGLGRFELHSLKLDLSREFWNVGRVLSAEFAVLLSDVDCNGRVNSELCNIRGCKWRYLIFNSYASWLNGHKPMECGDDQRIGRASFSGPCLHVRDTPNMWVNMTREETEDARGTVCWLIGEATQKIRASIYNINDAVVTDALVRAHHRGVDVHILTSSKYNSSEWYLNEQFKKLTANSVPLTIIMHDDSDISLAALTNHTKFAIFDDYRVITGSCNWESRAFDSNSESIVCIEDLKVAEMYQCIFDSIRGRPPYSFPVNHEDSLVKVFYSRCWGQILVKEICQEIDKARANIYMAMFVLRKLRQWEGDRLWDVFDSLVNAKLRGVDVWILLEANCHLGGKYKDRIIPEDKEYHELGERAGIRTYPIKAVHNNDPCAAMHQKFVVIDGYVTITGSFNFWDRSIRSDDDFCIIRSHPVAARHQDEVKRLIHWYLPHCAHDFGLSLGR
eukprot:TRINITY_DN22296_c0_g5_i1.p1 TRINITY_DN22296_c0_g5~~TRINITY_DN22296_c0_g5_i1.p1  ORF type:complete len:613 (+),score=58.91 TRINITY_DN22296_c0_g5_i1:65-1903(+)